MSASQEIGSKAEAPAANPFSRPEGVSSAVGASAPAASFVTWSAAEAALVLKWREGDHSYNQIRRMLIEEGYPARSKNGVVGLCKRDTLRAGGDLRRWTAEQREFAADAFRRGASYEQIADRMTRRWPAQPRTIHAVRQTLNAMHVGRAEQRRARREPVAKSHTKTLPCMTCDALFESVGPGNRMCNPCRSGA
jgi:hypothetical protein